MWLWEKLYKKFFFLNERRNTNNMKKNYIKRLHLFSTYAMWIFNWIEQYLNIYIKLPRIQITICQPKKLNYAGMWIFQWLRDEIIFNFFCCLKNSNRSNTDYNLKCNKKLNYRNNFFTAKILKCLQNKKLLLDVFTLLTYCYIEFLLKKNRDEWEIHFILHWFLFFIIISFVLIELKLKDVLNWWEISELAK